jgi:hypothetical protein
MDEAPKPRKKRYEWEAQYVADYVARKYPGVPCRLHARIGTPPEPATGMELEPAERNLLRVKMRWADAIVFLPDRTVVIEGKLRASELLKALGELELYVHLLPRTPEYAHLLADRIDGQILTPIADPTVDSLARRKGFRLVVWSPPWLDEYLASISHREKRPIRPEESRLI